jgi:hypothetical protein
MFLDTVGLEHKGLKGWKLQPAVKLKENQKHYQKANNIQQEMLQSEAAKSLEVDEAMAASEC